MACALKCTGRPNSHRLQARIYFQSRIRADLPV
jgi:hypothetical protein